MFGYFIGAGSPVINQCYATGSARLNGWGYKGGFIGQMYGGSITESFMKGNVYNSSDYRSAYIVGEEKDKVSKTISRTFYDKNASASTKKIVAYSQDGDHISIDNTNGITDFSNKQTFIDAGWSEDDWDFGGKLESKKWEEGDTKYTIIKKSINHPQIKRK